METKRLLSSILTVGVIGGLITGVVFAASATSNTKDIGPVNGYFYTTYAKDNSSNDVNNNNAVSGIATIAEIGFTSDGVADPLTVENNVNMEPVVEIKTNKNGLTYGSSLFTSEEDSPDLIEAYGIDGTFGYVLATDLNEELPKSPEEALARQNLRRNAGTERLIPLYDVEGDTVIGQFRIVSGKIIELEKE